MELSLICAMAENRVIGRNNKLPWHLSEDLKYFKRTTMGNCIIMGRKTYQSIGRALPGRTNIVVSRDKQFQAEAIKVANSIPAALKIAESVASKDGCTEAFVIGGAALYAAALPVAHRIHLTRVHAEVDGDTYFPEFEHQQWREVSRQDYCATASNPYNYSVCVLERSA